MTQYSYVTLEKCRRPKFVQQDSHYLLILKFKDFSRTSKDPQISLQFQGPILDGSLQHEQ